MPIVLNFKIDLYYVTRHAKRAMKSKFSKLISTVDIIAVFSVSITGIIFAWQNTYIYYYNNILDSDLRNFLGVFAKVLWVILQLSQNANTLLARLVFYNPHISSPTICKDLISHHIDNSECLFDLC